MDDSKIVTSPVRVDFHIHSAASVRTRDAGNEALARCTSDKIDTLVEKLGNPKLSINMCAITDHDCFDVEMYRALKSKEGHGTLKKVLPGVEFTVASQTTWAARFRFTWSRSSTIEVQTT